MAHIKKVLVGLTSYLIEPTLYITPSLSDGVYSASLIDFALDTGVAILVLFTDTNPADADALLKINNDTKYIYYNGNKIAANTFKTNHTYTLVYDGILWLVVGDIDTDTTYTISTGTENGKIKVTPSSGNAYEVSVYGLGSNAFNSTAYLPLSGGVMSGGIGLKSGNAAITNTNNKRIYWETTDTTPVLKGYITTATDGNMGIHSTGNLYFRPGDTNGAISTTTGTIMSNSAFYPYDTNTMSLGTSSKKWTTVYAATFDGATASLTHVKNQSDGLKIKYSTTIDYFIGVGTGNENHGLYDNKASGGAKWILYAGTNNKWVLDASVAWSNITSKPTTISGYGITDAKIANGIITLGSNTITPVTSVNGHEGSTVNVTAGDLGLSAALRFVGKTTSNMSESFTGVPEGITSYTTPIVGDVVLDKNSDAEYVCIAATTANNTTTYTWELLGRSGSWSLSDHEHGNITNGGLLDTASMAVVTDGSKKITTADLSVSDSNASTNATTTFVLAVTLSAQGQITVTKATLNTSGTWSGNAQKLGTTTVGDSQSTFYLNDGSPSAGNKVYLLLNGTETSNTNMNSYTTIGNYYCSRTATAKTMTNNPYATATSTNMTAFTLKVEASLGSGTNYLRLHWKAHSSSIEAERTSTNGGQSWSNWRTKIFKNSDASTALGSNTLPVYIDATGEAKTCTALCDLAYIDKPTSDQSTTFLRGDGTWATPSYTVNTDTKLRIYLSTTNIDIPIVGLNSGNATAAYASHTSGTKDVYGAISSTTANRATINPSTGLIKSPGGFLGDLTGNATTATTATYLGNIGRLTDMDIDLGNSTYNSKVFISYADANTTNNKPSANSIVFNIAWDNVSNNHYGALIAIHNSEKPHLQIRGCKNGTWDTSWFTVLDSGNTAAGTNNNSTLTWGTTYTIAKINGTNIKFTTMAEPTYAFTDLTSHPTTLSGYGITDATISNGIITLGSSTITPITSINNHTGSSVTLTAGDLGLSNALHFIGITSTELTDGDTTSTLSPLSGLSDSLSKTTGFVDGDVVIYDSTEFIKIGSKWNAIGDESSWAYRDHTHTASIAKAASGDTSNVTLAFGTKYKVTSGGSEYVFTMPSNPNTNNATRQQVNTTNKNYSLLFSALEVGTATNTSSYSTYRNDSVYVNPSTGIITANGFIGDIAGNADTATKLYTAVNIWGLSFDGSVDIIGDMTDVGPTFSLPSSAGNVFLFFTSTSTAAHGQFGKLSLYSNYDSATIDLNTYTLDVEGAVRFNIGASDSSTDKKFIIYGNSRYLSIGGLGLQAYGASDEAELYIQYHGGNIYFGLKMILTNSTTPILNSSANFTLSTSSSKTLTIRSGSTLYLGTNSSSSIIFQINGSTAAKEVARFNTSGHLVPYITSGTTTSNYQLGISDHRWKALFLGTADSYGDEYTPIYWNDGVPTEVAVVQKYTFSIANGSTTAVIAPTNTNKAKSIVTEMVVDSGIEYLNGPISWEIPTTGTNKDKIVLTTIATSGAVSGYILVSIG